MDMNEAAETLAWHEKWRAEAAARWKAAQPQPNRESWKPSFTPEQQAAHDEYVRANCLPF